MANGLTVLIPCKDEIDNIRPCIESVRDLADEILVADSGSCDGTLEAVKADSTCRVIQREFVNSGDFKNWAIPQAKHDWVFVLDADERVSPKLAIEIRSLLASRPKERGFWVYRLNYYMGHPLKHTSWGRDKVIRLIRRDGPRYLPYTDHSEIDLPSSEVGQLRERLIHYSCRDFDAYLRKMIRYANQQADLWYRQGRRPSVLRAVFTGPLRFLRSYVIELGLLDGMPGFHVSMLTGFYSFLKQVNLWQRHHGERLSRIDLGAEAGNAVEADKTIANSRVA